jgi:hypothetical protein
MILFFNGSYSQNKSKSSKKEPTIKESQEWIKSVIENYGHGKISFEGTDILYDIPSYPATHTVYNQRVSLKDLSSAKKGTGSEEGFVWLHVMCLNKKCVFVDCKTFNFNTNILQITLNGSISDDLKDRLVKAINHLIKLNSNNKIGNTF